MSLIVKEQADRRIEITSEEMLEKYGDLAPRIVVPPREWASFLADVKNGEFDDVADH